MSYSEGLEPNGAFEEVTMGNHIVHHWMNKVHCGQLCERDALLYAIIELHQEIQRLRGIVNESFQLEKASGV